MTEPEIGIENGKEMNAIRRQWQKAGRPVLGPLFFLVVIVGLILELIPANYYVLMPGQAINVQGMIAIKKYPVPAMRGALYMTDVSLYKVDHKLEQLVEHVYAWVNPGVELVPGPEISGGMSDAQYTHTNVQLMGDSVQAAQVAALRNVGLLRLTCADRAVTIAQTLPQAPASRVLRSGDIVRRLAGKPICRAADFSRVMRRQTVGRPLRVSVLRGSRLVTLQVDTLRARRQGLSLIPSATGHIAMVGIAMVDDVRAQRVHLPVPIRVDTNGIGGPSAGLMFTLAIVERLKHEDLTHGCKIAGTGTIDYDGNVGEIGGVEQKIIAASRAGARYFIVPNTPANVLPARANAHSIKVVPVSTLEQALRFLSHLRPCA